MVLKQSRRVPGALALLALAACATAPTPATAPEPAPAPATLVPAIDSVPRSGLGPQELAAGECGLFLWSQTDISKFIFFSRALSGTAVFAQAETPLALNQTGAGGDIFGQFNTQMRFAAVDGRSLSLTLVPGEELEGGQRVAQGLIDLTDPDGWKTKLPVLGVRACQPE